MLQNIINKYNALHGEVSREQIEELSTQMFDNLPEYPCLEFYYSKLSNLLNKYPDVEVFDIAVKTFANCHTGLNGAFDIDTSLRMPAGLNKPINEEQYKIINAKILELLSKGNLNWQKKWHTNRKNDAYIIAYNFDAKKEYKGLYNQMMLGAIMPQSEPLNNPYYLSKKQIEKHGGKLKKRYKTHYAFYYNVLYRVQFDDTFKLDFKTYDRNEIQKYLEGKRKNLPAFRKFVNKVTDGDIDRFISYYCTVPFMKSYQVFNGEDIEGIDFKLEEFKGKGKIPASQKLYKPNKKIPIAEKIIKSYPTPAPKIYRKEQDRAFYSPARDTITVPLLRQFASAQEFYGTLFHEMIHSTGHKNRLKRDFSGKFGSKSYAKEELIAEIGSSYLSAVAGILHFNIKNTAAYLKGWSSVLKDNIKNDEQFIIRASQQAKKATDFILKNFDDNVLVEKPKEKTITKPKVTQKKQEKTKQTEEKKKSIKKEAWQMSEDEFNKNFKASKTLDRQNGKPITIVNKLGQTKYQESYKVSIGNITGIGNTSKSAKRDLRRKIVKKAFEEGKPVPKRVLADFPELTKSKRKKTKEKKTTKLQPEKQITQQEASTLLRQFIKRRNTLPILDFALITSKGIYATNFDKYFLWQPNNIELPKQPVLINIKMLCDVLKLKTPVTKITAKGEVVAGSKIKQLQTSNDIDEYPEIIKADKTTKIGEFSGKKITYLFDKIASKDEIRDMLHGILFDTKNGKIVSTDAHVLVYDNANLNKSASYIIAKHGVKLPNRTVGIYSVTAHKNKFVLFKYDNISIFSSAKTGDDYPKYQSVIPSYKNYIEVDKKELLSALKSLKSYTEKPTYTIAFNIEDKIKITANNTELNISSTETVAIKNKKHKKLLTGFNNEYLIKLLTYIDDATIKFYYERENKAVIINDIALIMPIQLDGNGGMNGIPFDKNAKTKSVKKKAEKQIKTDDSLMSLADLNNTHNETFDIAGDIAKFLGNIERKAVGSVAVTTDGAQGSGKTTFTFQKIDAFARAGNKVLFVSLEEHPQSMIFKRKVKQYISPQASKNVFVLGELENGFETLKKYIPKFDAIFIDSWNKVVKEAKEKNGKRLDFDYDLRKAYNGKYFDTIFQRTQDGKMRGGSEAQFDGDVILKIPKGENFTDNYVYYDKNRYMIDNYIWNIAGQKLIKVE